MFYPTDQTEIIRMLGIIGDVYIPPQNKDLLRSELGEEYNNLMFAAMNSNIRSSDKYIFHTLLESNRIDLIQKYFAVQYGYSSNQTFSILDPFAGEAKWLEMFKTAINTTDYRPSGNIHLIANELEVNRYSNIKNNIHIDESYNKPFEEFNDLPRGSVSMLLYNPPYGSSNGIRNVKHYLQMVIDEKLIFNSKGNNSHKNNGQMIMVIRKDDLLDSLPLILKHFTIQSDLLCKVNPDEYARYKQYVVYCTLRDNPLSDSNVNEALKLQQEVSEVSAIVNSNPEFEPQMYEQYNKYKWADVPYHEMKKNYEMVNEETFEQSNVNNDNWNWIREMTEVKDVASERIVKALAPKTGELSNLIASGMINGHMQMKDGTGEHVVAGGIKKQLREEVEKEENSKGEMVTVKKKILYSEPYLNILVSENGKAKIIELNGGEG